MELFPVYIVQQVHPWLPDPEAQLARQDSAHLWLGIQNWREMLQCLNVVSVCGASSTLRCLCAFYVCNIFNFQKHWQKFSCMCVIFLFSKNIDKVFLISTFNSYVNWLKINCVCSFICTCRLLYNSFVYYFWTALLREIMAHWINLDVVFCCFYRQNLNKGVFENDLLSWKLFQMLPSFFKGPKQAVRALSLFDGISTGKELYLCLYSYSIQ